MSLLAAHLTDENYEALFEAARHQSKREVERLVASLDPQPAVRPSITSVPVRRSEPVVALLASVAHPEKSVLKLDLANALGGIRAWRGSESAPWRVF